MVCRRGCATPSFEGWPLTPKTGSNRCNLSSTPCAASRRATAIGGGRRRRRSGVRSSSWPSCCRSSDEAPCEGLDASMDRVWNDDRRARLERSFSRAPREGVAQVAGAFSQYARRWVESRSAVCRATRNSRGTVGRSARCPNELPRSAARRIPAGSRADRRWTARPGGRGDGGRVATAPTERMRRGRKDKRPVIASESEGCGASARAGPRPG